MNSTFSQALFWVWVIEIAVSGFNYFFLMNRVYQPKFGEPKSHQIGMSVRMFDKYGIYGMAIAAPALIGTQIAAMASVAAGVKPFRASTLIIASTLIWSAAIAIAMVAFDVRLDLS